MGGSWRVRWACLAVATIGACAAPALAAKRVQQTNEQLSVSGALVLSWQGDPARGCAAEGVCGEQGALVVTAPDGGELTTSGGNSIANLNASATVRVQRYVAGSVVGECVDVPGTNFSGPEVILPRSGESAQIEMGGLSSGRCAGPTPTDLGTLTVPVRRSGGPHPTYDLHANEPFAAGPFSGTLTSTLVLSRGAGIGQSESFSGSSGSSTPVASHRVFIERVEVSYRATGLPSTLDIGFTGSQDPFCQMLDSCGASGSLALSPGGGATTVSLEASRDVPAPVSAARALRDFRNGLIFAAFVGSPIAPLSLRETFTWPGGGECTDAAFTSGPILTIAPLARERRGAPISLALATEGQSELLRTHCPGPLSTDVFGQNEYGAIATGSATRAALLAPRTTLTLSDGGSFSGPGYSGNRGGGIELSLQRVSIKAGTRAVTT